jgi:transcription initiation factor TFIIA large subunit
MVPSNAGNYQHLGAQPHSQAPYVAQNHNAGPRIKPEPGLESPTGGQPAPFPQTAILPPSATQAQQRAAAQIHNQFGNRAAASISAIQGSMSQQQHQQNPQNMQQIPQQHSQQAYQQQQQQAYNARMQQPQQGQQGGINGGQGRGQPLSEAQYRQAMAAQAAQAQHRLQVQNGVTGAQNDGAGDEMEESATVIKRMNANGEEVMGRIEIDNLMRAKIAAMGQSMEGGGLMLPLHQATNSQKRQRKVKKSSSGPGQQDGPGSDDDENKELVKDEELDEDAINSDLDDPEDGLNDDDDDDEGMGHIMLCMYDKVQRVKNKW